MLEDTAAFRKEILHNVYIAHTQRNTHTHTHTHIHTHALKREKL